VLLRCPLTPLFRVRSDPARSTNQNCRCSSTPPPPLPPPLSTCSRTRQCERDERALSWWLPAERLASTCRASFATSLSQSNAHSVSPTVANEDDDGALLLSTSACVRLLRPGRAELVEAGDPTPPGRRLVALACSCARKHRRQEQAGGCLPLSPATRVPSPSGAPPNTAATSDLRPALSCSCRLSSSRSYATLLYT
jgi:hypothetical protein